MSEGHTINCELLRIPYVKLPGVAALDCMHLFRNLVDEMFNIFRSKFEVSASQLAGMAERYRLVARYPSVLQFMMHDLYEITDNTSSKEIIMQFVFAVPHLISIGTESRSCAMLVDTLAALMYIMLSDEISDDLLCLARSLCGRFVQLWIDTAGDRNCRSTVHALLHLPENVVEHGPLIFVAAFFHESNIVRLNRRVYTGMRLPEVLHNSMYHACGAKFFFHDVLEEVDVPANCRQYIQMLGPLQRLKKAVECEDGVKMFDGLPASEITRHTLDDVRNALRPITVVDHQEFRFFSSFAVDHRAEFSTAESCFRRESKTKDCFAVDADGNFLEVQYAFCTEHEGKRYGGILGYGIQPQDNWCCFPTFAGDHLLSKSSVRGRRDDCLIVVHATSIRYHAVNITRLVDNEDDALHLVKVPFCFSLS